MADLPQQLIKEISRTKVVSRPISRVPRTCSNELIEEISRTKLLAEQPQELIKKF